MDIVTGHVGSAHVTSWQDRDLNQGIFGPDTYILNVGSKLAATIISNNEIRIADGTLVMQGCQGVIQKGTYDTISIDNGTQGLKRNDLICAQYTKSAGVESMSLVVIKGTAASTPVDPSYTSGDIQNGDTPVQVPIYRVKLNGLTVESVTALVEEVGNISGGGPTTIRTGTASLPRQTGDGANLTTVYSELLPAGAYAVSFSLHTSEEDIPTMGVVIRAGIWTFRCSEPYNPSQYDSSVGVTGFIYLASPATVTFRAFQNTLSSNVDIPYSIAYKKVG